jgi:hypothetical protein
MPERVPALPAAELTLQLGLLGLTDCDIRTLLYHLDFKAILDYHSQMTLLAHCIWEQCYITIKDKEIFAINKILVDEVQKMGDFAVKHHESFKMHADCHPALIEHQERQLVQDLLAHPVDDTFLHKGEFLDEIEFLHRDLLTSVIPHLLEYIDNACHFLQTVSSLLELCRLSITSSVRMIERLKHLFCPLSLDKV